MNLYRNFLLKISVLLFILISFLIFLYSFSLMSGLSFFSIMIGFAITTFNFIIGLTSIKIGLHKSQEAFFKIILGGMTARLLLMLSVVFISLKFLNINKNSFIFSILFFYILYLIIEIIFLYMKKT